MRCARLLPLIGLTLLSGCMVKHTSANQQVRSTDFSWITPGQTTRAQIIGRIGPPPPFGSKNQTQLAIPPNSLHYLAFDERLRVLSLGYILSVNFIWGWGDSSEDIYIWFDQTGTVRRISHTRQDDDTISVVRFQEAQP